MIDSNFCIAGKKEQSSLGRGNNFLAQLFSIHLAFRVDDCFGLEESYLFNYIVPNLTP